MAMIVGVLHTKRLFSGTANGFYSDIFLGEQGSRVIITIPHCQELMMHSVLFLSSQPQGLSWSLGMIPLMRKTVLLIVQIEIIARELIVFYCNFDQPTHYSNLLFVLL